MSENLWPIVGSLSLLLNAYAAVSALRARRMAKGLSAVQANLDKRVRDLQAQYDSIRETDQEAAEKRQSWIDQNLKGQWRFQRIVGRLVLASIGYTGHRDGFQYGYPNKELVKLRRLNDWFCWIENDDIDNRKGWARLEVETNFWFPPDMNSEAAKEVEAAFQALGKEYLNG